jgi:hypothetical protein
MLIGSGLQALATSGKFKPVDFGQIRTAGDIDPIAKTGAWVKRMLQGHLNYFAVSGNHPSLWWFFDKVKRLWLASLKRRSQTARLSWERFIRLVARFFPPIRTLHPLPCHRFDAKTRGRSPVR